jgi:hypothetical protein
VTPRVASVKAKGDKVSVKVSCPATASSCLTATVTLTVPRGGRKRALIAKAKGKGNPKKPKPVTVGRASATLSPGTSKTITVGLNKAGRKLLAHHHTLTVDVTVTAGKTVLKRGSAVLKPEKKAKHQKR